MDLTQLANLGEFIGGVAVLVTLVYLARQVRQNNSLTRAQVEQEASRRSSDLLWAFTDAETTELALRAAVGYPDMAPIDQVRISGRILAFANYYETLFYARERGEVDDDYWESRVARMKWYFGACHPQIWAERRDGVGRRFREFVEAEILPDAPRPPGVET